MMDDLHLERLSDNASGDWVQSHSDEHFQQRYLRNEGPIFCETLMTVHARLDTSAAINLICGPWDWWEHGRITDFTVNPDGSSDQILSPVWWFITRVGLHIFPPHDLPELKGRRAPLLLTSGLHGTLEHGCPTRGRGHDHPRTLSWHRVSRTGNPDRVAGAAPGSGVRDHAGSFS